MSMVRLAGMVVLLLVSVGCSVSGNSYIRVTDPETSWRGTGFSVKAPSDLGWYKAPIDDSFPNAMVFFKQEGKIFLPKGNYWYLKGTQVMAASSLLDEPVRDRKDKGSLAEALKKHLLRYQRYYDERITNATYEQLSGLDCVRYSATPIREIQVTKRGDLYQRDINGYFCLHPDLDSFGVLMETRDVATAGTDTSPKTLQTGHFFTSLRFTPVSSDSRSFSRNDYPVGKWLDWPYVTDALETETSASKRR